MRLGKDLELKPIKLENKHSCKEIDSILERLNEELYFFYFLYYNKDVQLYMLKLFEDCGKELNNISISKANDGQIKRKKELIEVLRDYYKKLKKYLEFNNTGEVEKMCKYLVFMFLKDKKEMSEDVLYKKWLFLTHKVGKFFDVTDNLKSVNNEAVKYFTI